MQNITSYWRLLLLSCHPAYMPSKTWKSWCLTLLPSIWLHGSMQIHGEWLLADFCGSCDVWFLDGTAIMEVPVAYTFGFAILVTKTKHRAFFLQKKNIEHFKKKRPNIDICFLCIATAHMWTICSAFFFFIFKKIEISKIYIRFTIFQKYPPVARP